MKNNFIIISNVINYYIKDLLIIILCIFCFSSIYAQSIDGIWIASIHSYDDTGSSSSIGPTLFLNDSIFTEYSKGSYKLSKNQLEIHIPNIIKASGKFHHTNNYFQLQIDTTYGIMKEEEKKFINNLYIGKKFSNPGSTDIDLEEYLISDLWLVDNEANITSEVWKFHNNSEVIKDDGYTVRETRYRYYKFYNQIFIDLFDNKTLCYLLDVQGENLEFECFNWDIFTDEPNIELSSFESQHLLFKKIKYPSDEEYHDMKNFLIGKWDGGFIYDDKVEKSIMDSDSINYSDA